MKGSNNNGFQYFYLGALGAVAHPNGPPHWSRFVSSLESQPSTTSNDNKEEDEGLQSLVPIANRTNRTSDEFSGPRIGHLLPICCPRHGSLSTLMVSTAAKFPSSKEWKSFCRLPCPFVIPTCNHPCGKACHCPILEAHTTHKSCQV